MGSTNNCPAAKRIVASRVKFLLPALTLLVAGGTFTGLAQAATEKEGIGISPASQKLLVDPGQTVKKQLVVINEGGQPLKYRIYANNFTVRNEAYEKDFSAASTSPTVADWLSLPQGTRELPPNGVEKLDYTVTVPATAISQGYYGVIFVETTAPEADATGVVRVKRVGTLVYVGVKGGLVEKGRLVDFQAAGWQHQAPVRAQLRLQNDGNVHLAASGQVSLKDLFGRTVSQHVISGEVLPEKIRKFQLELPGRGMGLYKIQGTVHYGGQDITLQSSWILVAAPLWLAVCSLAVTAGLVLIKLWAIRHLRHRRRKQ